MTKTIAITCGLLLLAFLPTHWSTATIKVGSKQFTESIILGELLTQIAREQGVEVTHYQGLGGTRLVYNALVAGEIDAYPEYTGTVIQEIFAGQAINNVAEMHAALKKQGIAASGSLGFNNTYALGMLRSRAAELGITKISDLTRYPDLRWGLTSEFIERGDGWPALSQAYGLSPRHLQGLDHDLAYRQLASGVLEIIDVYSTDAKIKQLDLLVLNDDRQFFPRYDAIVLYRTALNDQFKPDQRWYLQLVDKISEAEMIAMNHQAEIEKQPEQQVANRFLQQSIEEGNPATVTPSGWFSRITQRTLEHLELVRKSLIPAIFVGIGLGVMAYLYPRLGRLILVLTGIVQTIPALALLVLIMPVVTALGLPALGVGSITAMVALFLYSLLPIVRGTHSGLLSIEPQYRESAEALGFSTRFRIWNIEIPLASRSIFSSIKTAAVINVGFATLGALIGGGGYGQPILTGIRRADYWTVLEGAIPAAALAIIVQMLFDLSEHWFVAPGLNLKSHE